MPELLDAIAQEAVPRLRDFEPQGLANTVWAYAMTGHAAPELLDAIAQEAVPRLREFNLQDLANTVCGPLPRLATKRRHCSTRSRKRRCRGCAT